MYQNTLPASALKIASSVSEFSSLAHALGPLPMVQPPPPPRQAVPTPIATAAASFAPFLQSVGLFDNSLPVDNVAFNNRGLDQTPRALLMMSGVYDSDTFVPYALEEFDPQLPNQPSFPTSNEAPTCIQTGDYLDIPYPFLLSLPIVPSPPIPPFTLNDPTSPLSPFAMASISRAAKLGGFFGTAQQNGQLIHSPFEQAHSAGDGIEYTGMHIQQHYSPPLPIALPSLPVNIRPTANPGFHTGDERTFGSSLSTLDGIQTGDNHHPRRAMGAPGMEDPFCADQRPMGSVARTPRSRRARQGAPYPTDYQLPDSRGHPLAPTGATTQHQLSNPRERVAPNFTTFGPSQDAGQMAGSSTSAVEQPTMPQWSSRSERKNRDPNIPGSAGWAQRSLQAQEENPLKGLSADLLHRVPIPSFKNESPETLARSIAEALKKSPPLKGKSSNCSARPSSSTKPPSPRPTENSHPPTPPRKPYQYCRSTDPIPPQPASPYQLLLAAPVEDDPGKERKYGDFAGGKLNIKVEPSPKAKADAQAAFERKEEKKLRTAAARKERTRKAAEAKKASRMKDGAKMGRTKKANAKEL